LATGDAVTNWDQGAMPLHHVTVALERLARARRIVGVDVCGDYSTPQFATTFQRALAAFDHPAMTRPSDAMLAINATTNAALLDCLKGVLT
jgi:hypothetical protein